MSDFLTIIENLELNEERFLELLGKLIKEAVHLQNNPEQGHFLTCLLLSFKLID